MMVVVCDTFNPDVLNACTLIINLFIHLDPFFFRPRVRAVKFFLGTQANQGSDHEAGSFLDEVES